MYMKGPSNSTFEVFHWSHEVIASAAPGLTVKPGIESFWSPFSIHPEEKKATYQCALFLHKTCCMVAMFCCFFNSWQFVVVVVFVFFVFVRFFY